RAFLALLHCALEDLSARRFAEYLSLGQVPAVVEAAWTPSQDEAIASGGDMAAQSRAAAEDGPAAEEQSEEGGQLPTPGRWERLIDAASVIGGAARWRRRLDGLRAEYSLRLAEVSRDEPDRTGHLRADIDRLDRLRAFALPLVEEMGDWPASAT